MKEERLFIGVFLSALLRSLSSTKFIILTTLT